jgi:hypothetical protein
MLLPSNHHLAIFDRYGTLIRGNVVYIQPAEERWIEFTAEIHFRSSDWLAQHRYSAIYHTATESLVGFFTAYRSRHVEEREESVYLYQGIFAKVAE